MPCFYTGTDLLNILQNLRLERILEERNRRLVDIGALTVAQLKEECESRNLATTGRKASLVDRLREHLGAGVQV